jgi:hypothetical protein
MSSAIGINRKAVTEQVGKLVEKLMHNGPWVFMGRMEAHKK